MSSLYPHVAPMQATAPDYHYLRQITETRSPHLLVTGIVGHAHAWELAVGLGSLEGAEHHQQLVYVLWNQMALLTGKIRQQEDARHAAAARQMPGASPEG